MQWRSLPLKWDSVTQIEYNSDIITGESFLVISPLVWCCLHNRSPFDLIDEKTPSKTQRELLRPLVNLIIMMFPFASTVKWPLLPVKVPNKGLLSSLPLKIWIWVSFLNESNRNCVKFKRTLWLAGTVINQRQDRWFLAESELITPWLPFDTK